MKKLASVLFFLAFMCLPMSGMAKQSYDLSDVSEPFLSLPFDVVSVDVSGEGAETRHNYHISVSYDQVIKKLKTMLDKKQKINDFYVFGMTKQTGSEKYQVILAYQNEHHYVHVTPEGSGTLFSIAAFPSSYLTGVFPVAIYGFILPDGSVSQSVKSIDE